MPRAYQVAAYDDDGEIITWTNVSTQEKAEDQVQVYLEQGAPDASWIEVEVPTREEF